MLMSSLHWEASNWTQMPQQEEGSLPSTCWLHSC